MTLYDASNPKHLRRAAKAAKSADADRRIVVLNLMSSPSGRDYVHTQLTRCHCFHSSFSSSALAMAFAEGERNVGLQLLNDVMAFAPDQYVQMMREATDKELADARRSDDNRSNGRGPDPGRDDSGHDLDDATGRVDSEYDPGDDERADGES